MFKSLFQWLTICHKKTKTGWESFCDRHGINGVFRYGQFYLGCIFIVLTILFTIYNPKNNGSVFDFRKSLEDTKKQLDINDKDIEQSKSDLIDDTKDLKRLHNYTEKDLDKLNVKDESEQQESESDSGWSIDSETESDSKTDDDAPIFLE